MRRMGALLLMLLLAGGAGAGVGTGADNSQNRTDVLSEEEGHGWTAAEEAPRAANTTNEDKEDKDGWLDLDWVLDLTTKSSLNLLPSHRHREAFMNEHAADPFKDSASYGGWGVGGKHLGGKQECERACGGRLVGGKWHEYTVEASEGCLRYNAFNSTPRDPWVGMGFDGFGVDGTRTTPEPPDYCAFFEVEGCARLHGSADSVIRALARHNVTHLRFVGDSVTAQHYYLFIRLLESRRRFQPIRLPLGNWESPDTSVYSYCEDTFQAQGGLQLVTSLMELQTPLGNLPWRREHADQEALFLRRGLLCTGRDIMWALFNHNVSQLADLPPCAPVSAVVMNFGLHYLQRQWNPSFTMKELYDLVTPDHERLLGTLAAFPHMKKVYREATPVHGNGKQACMPFERLPVLPVPDATNETQVYKSPMATQNLSSSIARYPLGSDGATLRRLRDAGIIFLEVWDMMLPRWFDHATTKDCIHWTMPGPQIAWIEAMLDGMLCGRQRTREHYLAVRKQHSS